MGRKKVRVVCRICERSHSPRRDYIEVEGWSMTPLCPGCAEDMYQRNEQARNEVDEDGHFRLTCFKCFSVKRDDEFGIVKGKRSCCLVCNRQRRRITDSLRRRPVWEFIKSFKDGTPCHDCGLDWPYYVLEFDHREPEKKSFTVSAMVNSHWREKDWGGISDEIAKCDVVCRNCHVIRSHGRGNRGQRRTYDPSDEDIDFDSGLSAPTSSVRPSVEIEIAPKADPKSEFDDTGQQMLFGFLD